jgi:hypothetical protein
MRIKDAEAVEGSTLDVGVVVTWLWVGVTTWVAGTGVGDSNPIKEHPAVKSKRQKASSARNVIERSSFSLL